MRIEPLEIKRKFVHIITGVLAVVLLNLGLIDKMHIFYLIIAGIIISVLSKKYKIPVIHWLMVHLERDQNIKHFPLKSLLFYFIGIFFVVSFFPMDIAIPSILILALSDPISYIFGVRFGKVKNPFASAKFIEGWIAGLIAGFTAAYLFLPWYEALAGSFFAMVAECIDTRIGAEEVDDNIVMPIAAAVAIWIIRTLV